MKKTLVALAAVAATGGAFAQATMTGNVTFGWYQTVSSTGAQSSGFGNDGNSISFSMTEDLDGGYSVNGAIGIDIGDQSGSASASRDISLTLKTPSMGSFKFQSNKGGDYLSNGIAAVGSDFETDLTSGTGSYTGPFSTRANLDNVVWSFPLSTELTVSVAYVENTTDGGIGSGASGNSGSYAAADMQRYNQYSLTYKSGPLVADAGYRTYDQASAQTTNASTRNRGSASYDMGVAKIGAGWSQTTYNYGNTNTDTLVGLSIPLGQLTLSAQLGNRTKSGNAAALSDTSASGRVIHAQYALSKRTYLNAGYKAYDNVATTGATSTPTLFYTTIGHNF